jgi:hypothetical protein
MQAGFMDVCNMESGFHAYATQVPRCLLHQFEYRQTKNGRCSLLPLPHPDGTTKLCS